MAGFTRECCAEIAWLAGGARGRICAIRAVGNARFADQCEDCLVDCVVGRGLVWKIGWVALVALKVRAAALAVGHVATQAT